MKEDFRRALEGCAADEYEWGAMLPVIVKQLDLGTMTIENGCSLHLRSRASVSASCLHSAIDSYAPSTDSVRCALERREECWASGKLGLRIASEVSPLAS